MIRTKLFAFPYAGGSSLHYFKWKNLLNDYIELVPVELAGRGTRPKAPLCNTFSAAVEDLYKQIEHIIDESPYAFFGHSMGSLLAYELAHTLRDRGKKEPNVMFMSGRWAPHIERTELVDLMSSDECLKERLLELGGASPDLFENKHLSDLFIPILRADFCLMESYEYKNNRQPLSAAMSVMTGMKDVDVNKHDLIEWGNHTNGRLSIHKFRGGHFFINDSFDAVIQHINRLLGMELY